MEQNNIAAANIPGSLDYSRIGLGHLHVDLAASTVVIALELSIRMEVWKLKFDHHTRLRTHYTPSICCMVSTFQQHLSINEGPVDGIT